MKLTTSACSVLLLALLVPGQAPENLVANGDFREVADGKPQYWEAAGDSSRVTQKLEAVQDGGIICARLVCTRIEGEGGATHAMLAQVGRVRLRAGRLYEFSCRARQEGIRGKSVSVAVSDTSTWTNCGLEASLGVEGTWKTFRVVFRATKTVDRTSRLQFWFLETGSLYIADVRIVEVAAQQVEFTDTVPSANRPNLVRNGSFALGGAGWASYGTTVGWGNLAHLHGTVVRADDPAHPHFLRIPMGPRRAPVLAFDYFRATTRIQSTVLAATRGWIPVDPDATYTLSADMRTSLDGTRGGLGYVALDPEGSQWNLRSDVRPLALASAWKRYTITFRPPCRYVFILAGAYEVGERRTDVDVDNVMLCKGTPTPAYAPHAPVEVAVEPARPGGVITGRDGAFLVVRASNADTRSHSVTVRLEGADCFRRRVAMRPIQLNVGPGQSCETKAAVPPSWKGWYALKVSADSAPGTAAVVTPEVRLSVVPPPSGPTFIGMNHAFPDPWLLPIARAAGVSEYRDWSLKWDHIEPSPGDYHWEIADAQFERVWAAGASVLPLLPPFPSAEWSSTAPEHLRSAGYPGERLRQAWAPRDSGLLADFARRAVERYRGRVSAWEFLNEPIYTDYSLPRSHYTPRDYVELLKPVAQAIKAADPRALVVGGAGAGPAGVTREMIDAGVLDLVDVLNLHIYPGSRAPEGYVAEMDRLVAEMKRLGRQRPIWITEFSYYGVDNLPRRPFIPEPNDWAQNRLLDDERQCAEYTVRFCLIMLARGCEKIHIHSGSSGAVNMPSFECCLFDYGGAPRKVASALAILTNLLGPRPRSVRCPALPDGVYAAAFETDRAAVVAVWATVEGVGLRVPGGVEVRDIMGRSLGQRLAALGESPVFLIGRRGAAATLARRITVTTGSSR